MKRTRHGLLTRVFRPEGGNSRNLGGSERVAMDTLGVDVDATAAANAKTVCS